MDWFRWYNGSVSDPKFQLVAKRSGASVAEVVAVWALLLECASASTDRGNPGAPDFEAIDCALGLADGRAEVIFKAMQDRALIDPQSGRICAWEKRQPKRERDDPNAYERVKAYRERKRHETPSNASDATCNAKDTLEERRGEKREREARAMRLPDDWSPSREETRFALETQATWDLAYVVVVGEKFRDYWRAQPGAKGRKVDWSATWRNWVRNEKPRPKLAAVAGSEPWAGAI